MHEPINEDKTAMQIKESLDQLDRFMTVKTPDMTVFRGMVAEAGKKKREKARRELVIFAFLAAVILTIEVVAFNLSFMFFAVIQGAGLVTCIIAVFRMLRQGHRKVNPI